jgi:hypothetical protein
MIAGNVYWVDSASGGDGNPGTFVRPLATLDAAINKCTSSNGDFIFVKPGHAETVTATSIALDVAGVTVHCLGNAEDQAVFTYGAAAATITVSAANCKWIGGHHLANFDNVAAAFTLGTAKGFTLTGAKFEDGTAALHFLSIVVTGATDNDADDLSVVDNTWYALALAPNAFVSILAAELRTTIAGNKVNMLATNDVGHFITLAAKIVSGARIVDNELIVTGATDAAVGIFLTGSGTTSTGIVARNLVASLDTTAELIATAGTGLKYFENYYTGVADKSGKLWPAVDAA